MKKIIITGAAGNLGKAVVQKFLDGGWTVLATILPGESVDEFTPHTHFSAHALDVTNEAASTEWVRQLVNVHRTIDAAALLVGGFAMGGITETSGDDLRKMFRLNFESAYFLGRALFNQMTIQPTGGRLFLTGARPALSPEAGKGTVAYALSKGLLFHLAELLNAEGKSKNIVTSVIAPSIIDTPPNRQAMPDADFATWVTPAQIADVIYFAASDTGAPLREPVLKVYGKA